MTIDEAVERLRRFHDQAAFNLDATSAHAFELGIEGLKLVKELRECMPGSATKLLPGETQGDA